MLKLSPAERYNANDIINHKWFKTEPLPTHTDNLNILP